MPDHVTRSAAKLAALIAVPLAVLAGLGAYALLSDAFRGAAEPAPTPTAERTEPAPVPTEPVEMAARDLTQRQETVCRALLSQLPDQLDALAQRPVTEGAEQNAAYGEPPVTVACGVAAADYQPTDTVYPLEGVCWHATEQSGASVWTTLDREVPVQVTVPAAYDGASQRVMEFSPILIETVRSHDTAPSGCQS